MKERILILVVSYHTINFFRKIILKLLAKGHDVRVLAIHELPYGAKEDKFDTHRANWHHFEWDKIDAFNPTRVIVFNGYFRLIHASVNVLRSFYKTLFVEIAWFPQTSYIYLDQDIHHMGSIATSVSKAQKLDRVRMKEIITSKKPHLDALRVKYAPTGKIPENLPERFLLVPLQLERDTSIVYSSPCFKDMSSLVGYFRRTAKLANIPLVVKAHPKANTDELENASLFHADLILKTNDYSMNALSHKATVIGGANSTSLMEAMIHYKPILQRGYNIADKNATCITLNDPAYTSLPALLHGLETKESVVDKERIDITLLTLLANQILFNDPPDWVSEQIINGTVTGRGPEEL